MARIFITGSAGGLGRAAAQTLLDVELRSGWPPSTSTSFSIAHSAAGFAELIGRLGRLAAPGDVAIGIERPDGRLVDACSTPGIR